MVKTMQKRDMAPYIAFLLIFGGTLANALPYDYTAITNCVADPQRPQYKGGIIVNPEINEGLKGWTTFGDVKIEHRVSNKGNNFMVSHSRKHPFDSVSQNVLLLKDMFYTFSAWVQVNAKSNVTITAVFKTKEGFKYAGGVIANAGCWSMLKGGVSVHSSGLTQLYFQSDDTSVDIWVDSVSLQPFTEEEWRAHQDQTVENVRKSKVKLQVLDAKGVPLAYRNLTLRKGKISFPFGVAINNNILTNNAYRSWFTQRFTVTTFENEMKWYSTERSRGKEDYSTSDAMLRFCKVHGISVRGHNIFWDDPSYQPGWIYGLSRNELRAATERRMKSIVPRYAGKLLSWDVNNENLHFNYFESKIMSKVTNHFFRRTRYFDRKARLFVNDYNTIEDNRDPLSLPSKYLQKLRQIQASLGDSLLGIGIEGHFDTPNIPYMRSALDALASAGLPIWITELDVRGSNQAKYLEQILREAYAHPAIKGIVIWSAWSPQGCYRMCLTDNNFRNLATGNVVDNMLRNWGHQSSIFGTTDANGYLNASLFHGDYNLHFVQQPITLLDESSSLPSQSFTVVDNVVEQDVKVIVQGST
ncbi:endo-1,4-beta-xylanase 5-like [Silene latifolia]|uniref:endo-1,4-beta-xylanase 5-like n=1 Tax=Silene latifolia TaxID=37657 RepID=UPI003D76C357